MIEELPERIEIIETPTESGETKVQSIRTKSIKKKQGPREELIEIKTTEEEGKFSLFCEHENTKLQ